MKTYPVYLNGNWVVADNSAPVINPGNGEAFARMSMGDRSQAAQAVADAHAAFGSWRQVTGRGRGELLEKIAAELERRREEIARIITLENGKPIAQSQGEVAMSVDHLRWFAGEARRIYGRVVPQQVETKRHLVIKSPIGVVAAISPWNFPLVLAVRKIAPALAAGCTVILKPASRTPLSAVAFAECVATVGLPSGVFQLVTGPAADLAAEFLDNPLCRKITFTGSTEVGQKLIAGAAKKVKPLSLELGGNAPLLVFEDSPIDEAVKGTLMAKFRNNGQSCIAANRIYVQRNVYAAFLRSLTEKVKAMVVGEGIDPTSQIGPLIDEEAVAKAEEHVQDAVDGGAKLLCGGKRMTRSGFFFEPTVIEGVGRNSLCMYEETFAPVAPVTPFENEKEAIELANNSNYGLSAYVFTRDTARMFRLAEALEAGTIGINDGVPTTSQCPFGGTKQSGWGRELGTEGIDAFLETKHISIEMD
jgi:succinate-semialdehyde dehydrogenase/glutarate-semialdehyde dehydrogenase